MSNTSTGVSKTLHLANCPACKRSITAHVNYDVTLNDETVGNEVVTATLRPSGLLASHDCRKKATR